MIAVDSSDSTLGSTGVIKLGANVQFTGDSNSNITECLLFLKQIHLLEQL